MAGTFRAAPLLLLLFVLPLVTATPLVGEWRDKVIYQVLTDRFAMSNGKSTSCTDLATYCGGTFAGMSDKLDYIAGLGATAIWISPVVANFEGGYHGYWMMDLDAINSNFGSEQDLKDLVEAAHKKGLWVMVDVVANHVGPVDMDFSAVKPFNESSHYHTKCQITDFGNQPQVEQCRLQNLPDLDQHNNYVSQTLNDWISNLVDTYNFDGVRVDTVPEIHIDFWDGFNNAAHAYCLGEVFNGNLDYVGNYQRHMDGVLAYPLFFAMRNAFAYQQSNMQQELENLLGPNGLWWNKFKDVSLLAPFFDNHDNPRFLNGRYDVPAYKGAIALTLLTTGIPIIYYGTEQLFAGGLDPSNRETLWPHYDTSSDMYQFICTLHFSNRPQHITDICHTAAKILKHRSAHSLHNAKQVQRYAAQNIYSFSRGDTVVCATNAGQNTNVQFDLTYLPDGWKQGTTVCNILNTSDCATVDQSKVHVVLANGEPKIYAPVSSLVD